MNQQLKKVLEYIQNEHQNISMSGARHYFNVNIGKVSLKPFTANGSMILNFV
jgi:hypothetical protein